MGRLHLERYCQQRGEGLDTPVVALAEIFGRLAGLEPAEAAASAVVVAGLRGLISATAARGARRQTAQVAAAALVARDAVVRGSTIIPMGAAGHPPSPMAMLPGGDLVDHLRTAMSPGRATVRPRLSSAGSPLTSSWGAAGPEVAPRWMVGTVAPAPAVAAAVNMYHPRPDVAATEVLAAVAAGLGTARCQALSAQEVVGG